MIDTAPEAVVPPPATLAARRAHPPIRTSSPCARWRHAAAVAAGLPETMVCTDKALAAVARARPASIDELAALPEIGPIAARRLGPRLRAILASQSR